MRIPEHLMAKAISHVFAEAETAAWAEYEYREAETAAWIEYEERVAARTLMLEIAEREAYAEDHERLLKLSQWARIKQEKARAKALRTKKRNVWMSVYGYEADDFGYRGVLKAETASKHEEWKARQKAYNQTHQAKFKNYGKR